MKYLNHKLVYTAVASAIIVLALILINNLFIVKKGVRYGYSRNIKSIVNVHESDTPWLSINNDIFYYVKGGPPFYLAVPSTRYIYFVTEKPHDNKIIHFYSLNNGNDIKFSGENYFLGYRLWMKGSEREWIEFGSENLIIVRTKSESREDRYTFDLVSKTSKKEIIK